MGLSEAIAEAAVRRAAGRRVTAVRVRIGGHPVDPEVIEQGFRLAAAGTTVEDAAVDLVMDPMSVRCRGCGAQSPVTDHLAMIACPGCGGVDIELSGSDDAVLESITLVAPEQPEEVPEQAR